MALMGMEVMLVVEKYKMIGVMVEVAVYAQFHAPYFWVVEQSSTINMCRVE
tara:strand:- start:490 stop:642 length:153 start_codon:yes stop_codon:yes gene_type:complete